MKAHLVERLVRSIGCPWPANCHACGAPIGPEEEIGFTVTKVVSSAGSPLMALTHLRCGNLPVPDPPEPTLGHGAYLTAKELPRAGYPDNR